MSVLGICLGSQLLGSLNRAIEYAENSELLRETLGDHIFEQFITSKKVEWDQDSSLRIREISAGSLNYQQRL